MEAGKGEGKGLSLQSFLIFSPDGVNFPSRGQLFWWKGASSCSKSSREYPEIYTEGAVQGVIYAPGAVQVSMSHLLLSCHGKDSQSQSCSSSLDYTWKSLYGEQSISQQEFEITWNGWDPKWQSRRARGGCRGRWFLLKKETPREGNAKGCLLLRGRSVGQGCRWVRAPGDRVTDLGGQWLQFADAWREEAAN